jgi:hypothetical protein
MPAEAFIGHVPAAQAEHRKLLRKPMIQEQIVKRHISLRQARSPPPPKITKTLGLSNLWSCMKPPLLSTRHRTGGNRSGLLPPLPLHIRPFAEILSGCAPYRTALLRRSLHQAVIRLVEFLHTLIFKLSRDIIEIDSYLKIPPLKKKIGHQFRRVKL